MRLGYTASKSVRQIQYTDISIHIDEVMEKGYFRRTLYMTSPPIVMLSINFYCSANWLPAGIASKCIACICTLHLNLFRGECTELRQDLEFDSSSQYWQKHATGPCPEPVESSPQIYSMLLSSSEEQGIRRSGEQSVTNSRELFWIRGCDNADIWSE
jgi:hypothetical protein